MSTSSWVLSTYEIRKNHPVFFIFASFCKFLRSPNPVYWCAAKPQYVKNFNFDSLDCLSRAFNHFSAVTLFEILHIFFDRFDLLQVAPGDENGTVIVRAPRVSPQPYGGTALKVSSHVMMSIPFSCSVLAICIINIIIHP